MYCRKCGKEIADDAEFCPYCGTRTHDEVHEATFEAKGDGSQYNAANNTPAKDDNISDKSWLITLLLCIFVGSLGIHRFYVGKIGTGILWLLTAGCFGIGTLIDLIMIIMGEFTDIDGRKIPVSDKL